jgi:hypothetical protein
VASVIREIVVDASPEEVWAVVGDFADGPRRMSGGLVDSRLDEPDVRALTFPDGSTARERFISRDERARRIVYGWVADDVAHDNTSMQVFAEGYGRSRLVWIHDTLPDKHADWLAPTMDQFAPVIQRVLGAPADRDKP